MNREYSWRRMALRLGAGALAATIASAVFVLPSQAAQAAPGDVAMIPDAALRECLNKQIDSSRPTDAQIKVHELESLQHLDCGGSRNIKELDGLDHATSLLRLDLQNNQIIDVTQLSPLTKLTDLNLDNNLVTNVTPLSQLKQLTTLNLGYNKIINVTPLSNLEAIKSLGLNFNQIIDVTPLSHLKQLTALWLEWNQIVDVTALSHLENIGSLSLGGNRIQDVTPLSHLDKLTFLGLSANQIVDVAPLSHMTKLTWGSFGGQSVTLPEVAVGKYFNPLVGPGGPLRVLEASNPGDLVSRASDPAYSWQTGGSKTGSWNTDVAIGSAKIPFSGTFTQQVVGVPPVVKHTVKFNLGGHGTPLTDVVVIEGTKVTQPRNPAATGWTFQGWYTDAAFATAHDFNTAVTGDATVYAKWSKVAQPKAPCSVPRTIPVFVDALTSHKFYTEIDWMQCMKYSTGYSDKTYRPSGDLSREAMAAFIYRLQAPQNYTAPQVSPFTDVPTDHKFYTEIAWMKTSGLSTGYADGTYRPSDNLSREAMAAFIYRLEGKGSAKTPTDAPFVDVSMTQKFAKEIAWMKTTKLTTGYADGTYKPKGNLSREAMAAFIYRLVVNYRQ